MSNLEFSYLWLYFILIEKNWKEVGQLLYESVLYNFKTKSLTKSQSIGLVVVGNKPGKGDSIKVKDKHRISLLNADYKVNSGVLTTRLNKVSDKGLSPAQYVSGSDRRIHHCINMTRDAVFKGNANTRKGSGIQDNDFHAAFVLIMSEWAIQVLDKKGCGETFKDWIKSLFTNVVSIVVVNGVTGATIKLERSLRQGDIPSMIMFAYRLDPYLERIRSKLEGIVIYSANLAVQGPVGEGENPLPPLNVEERFTAFGYAEDVTNSIVGIHEFAIVDEETKVFEQASGCALHRDPTSQKVKFLQDLPAQCTHISIADHLDMLGIPLYAFYRKTQEESGDEMIKKCKNTVGPWLIRRVPFTQQPWSINTYLYSKLYHRCHILPLRKADFNDIAKQSNRILYCDQFEKPGPVVVHKPKDKRGLGLHSVKEKSKAFLIKSFLETAVNPNFKRNHFHEAIYKFYVRNDNSVTDPGLLLYFSGDFIDTITEAELEKLQTATMSTNDWYIHLLDKNLLEKSIDGDLTTKKCKAELMFPLMDWEGTWKLARLNGISNESRSFLFRMLQNLHPTKGRLHHCRSVFSVKNNKR